MLLRLVAWLGSIAAGLGLVSAIRANAIPSDLVPVTVCTAVGCILLGSLGLVSETRPLVRMGSETIQVAGRGLRANLFVNRTYAAGREQAIRVMHEIALPLLAEIADTSGLRLGELGMTVYRVTRPEEGLEIVMNVAMSGRPAWQVSWLSDNGGPVGRSLSSGSAIVMDLTPLRSLTRKDFQRMPAMSRFDMTWQEFQRISGFAAIWIEPLRNKGGSIVGALSVDSLTPDSAARLQMAMNGGAVRGLAVLAGRMAEPLLEPHDGSRALRFRRH